MAERSAAGEPALDPALTAALDELAAQPELLVATDFDGVLAPLVDDPMTSRAVHGAADSLELLARLPGVTVAVVSGRALETLRELTALSERVLLIGSHGAEASWGGDRELPPEAERLLATLDGELTDVVGRHPGARLERKPTSRVVHTRGLPPEAARQCLEAAGSVAARHTEVRTTPGKDVLELAVVEAGKGPAIAQLAASRGATGVLYAGDDVTDELAFEHLGRVDGLLTVLVKVGAGETVAEHRLPDEPAVVELLREVARRRP